MSSSANVEENSSSYFFDSCLQLCALFIAFFIVAYKFIFRFSARLFSRSILPQFPVVYL